MPYCHRHFQGQNGLHIAGRTLDGPAPAGYSVAVIAQERAELSPGGYGIHWALLDEDLSLGGLVG